MSKNVVYLIVLVVLLGVAGWLISSREGNSTLERKMDYSFTIKDTAAVDKIIIKDKTPSEVVLSRNSKGKWLVGNEFPVRKDAIDVLLMTLYRMELRNFLPQKLKPIVIKRMATFGKEVQVYKNGELFKTFYVGTETADEMGTYMMIKGSDAPYAVHIPGFNGYLSSRFFTQPHLWKSRDITRMNPRTIREVELTYPDSANASFRLTVFSPDSLFFTNLRTGKPVKNINKVKAILFLNALGNMKYQGAILPSDGIWARRDSLLASTPVFNLRIKDIDGRTTRLEGYKIIGPAESFDPDLDAPEFDRDLMHGFINREEMVLLQYYGLQNVLVPLGFFVEGEIQTMQIDPDVLRQDQ